MPAVVALIWSVLGAGVTGMLAPILVDCPKLAQVDAWPLWVMAGISAGVAKYTRSGRPKE
jgi:hypothetical protein